MGIVRAVPRYPVSRTHLESTLVDSPPMLLPLTQVAMFILTAVQ